MKNKKKKARPRMFRLYEIRRAFKHWEKIWCESQGRDARIDWYNFKVDLGAIKRK